MHQKANKNKEPLTTTNLKLKGKPVIHQTKTAVKDAKFTAAECLEQPAAGSKSPVLRSAIFLQTWSNLQ